MKPFAAGWRLTVMGIVAVLLLVLLLNAMTQPVAVKQHSYTADFTDVAGLHDGADVRVRGVRVGKVDSIDVHRSGEQNVARVGFTLDSRFSLGPDSKLAIKYQALTGLRYMDVQNAVDGPAVRPLTYLPTSMTVPSFDMTKLFNGLQPVLATLSPDDMNTFTANVEAYLAGDGRGLGPLLDSMHTMTRFLADRQQVIATLLQNLKAVADTMGGHSKEFMQILDYANRPVNGAMDVLDELRKSQIYGPAFGQAVTVLLTSLGLKKGIDIDAALDKDITNVDDFISAIKVLPVMWENIPPPADVGQPVPCSKGRAELPFAVDVLLKGQRVVLCKP